MTFLEQFLSNKIIGVSVLAWFVAQVIKILIELGRSKRVNWRLLVSSGAMPSSHSAFVTSLATSVGITQGFDSSQFAISFILCLVVMYDAAGVRRAAGKQAEAINDIADVIEDLGYEQDETLKELLGHTPMEVTAGAVLGVLLSVIMYSL